VSVQPPSGTVTFLFTDIEQSTRLGESMVGVAANKISDASM
jgi:hypothetical protein